MQFDPYLAPRKTPRSLQRFGLTKESFLEETDFDEVFFKALIRKRNGNDGELALKVKTTYSLKTLNLIASL